MGTRTDSKISSLIGVVAASLTTPADVLKTRMQVEAKKGEGYTSLLGTPSDLSQFVRPYQMRSNFSSVRKRLLPQGEDK